MPYGSNQTAQSNNMDAAKEVRREVAPVTSANKDPNLHAVLRALAGTWVDPDELGYDLTSHHVAVLADDPAVFDAHPAQTQRQLLRVHAPNGGTWTWLGGRTTFSEEELDALIALHTSLDARVSFGEPAQGIAGFAASFQQAQEARVIGDATNQRAVRFANFRVLSAVLRDGDLAKELVEYELDELDRPSERMSELRETLRVYLEHSQSVSATAALRRRNRKTIERQLRSIEHLIHHRVSDRIVEVMIALQIGDILRQDM